MAIHVVRGHCLFFGFHRFHRGPVLSALLKPTDKRGSETCVHDLYYYSCITAIHIPYFFLTK